MNDDVLVMAINGLEATVTEMKQHYPTISDLLKRIESLENQYQFLAARHNLVAKRLAEVEGYTQEYETTTGE